MARILLVLLAVPAAGLLVHRGDPADSKTIKGDDCGNVKQINGKWAKAKKVGGLAGEAKAAVMGAELAAKNTEDAVKQAEALGKKIGQKGEIPEAVKSAAKVASEAAKTATKVAGKLDTSTDTFKGKFDDFAKAISDDDIVKLQKETEEANVAAQDAIDAAERALKKANDEKEKAMKSSAGALAMIDSVLSDTTKLSEQVGVVSQKSKHAAEDVSDLVKKSKAAAKKIDGKIKDAKEQKPVWEAYKKDLEGREKAAEDSAKGVTDAIKDLESAAKEIDSKAKTLKDVKDKGQSSPNALLGQNENIDACEAEIRNTERLLEHLKGKVGTMMKDSERLAGKIAETDKRLSK